MKIGPNEPAFPVPMVKDSYDTNRFVTEYGPMGGMTYRQWAVVELAKGFCSNPNYDSVPSNGIAQLAIGHVNAIIAELNKEESK